MTKYAVIEPYVDLKHLDTVLVLDKGAKQSGKSTAKANTQANPDAAEPTDPTDPDTAEPDTTGVAE